MSRPEAGPWAQDPAALAAALQVDPARGLAASEAAARLRAHGANRFRSAPPVPAWRRLLLQLRDPLVYLLLVAVAISLGAWWVERSHAWPVDALVILAIVLANAILGFVQEARADRAAAALARMSEATATVLRDGTRGTVLSADLVPGDVLLLGEGDAVGADARLVSAAGLRVQEAALTGESQPVDKLAGLLAGDVPLAERSNMVFKGTAVTQGSGVALVTATGMATEMGQVAGLLEQTVEAPTPLQREVARVGRTLGVAVLAVAVLVVATVLLLTGVRDATGLVPVLLLGVSLAVAAVPEGLPAILSLVLALGVQRMARHNAIVRKLSSVETLGSATVVCSDKTGTLTRSEMTILRLATASGTARLGGVGYAPDGAVELEPAGDGGVDALRAEDIVVLCGGSLAGNAHLQQGGDGGWTIAGDPTEAAFLVAERKLGADARRSRRFERVRELPFTAERKMMSVLVRDHEHGGALVLVAKGAPDVLLSHCTQVRHGLGVVALGREERARILAEVDALSGQALRTLAVAYRPLPEGDPGSGPDALERDLVFAGVAGMLDPPRAEAAAAIREAQGAGIRVVMITGDHPRTAGRIAADLGIIAEGAPVVTGADLEVMDEPALREAVRRSSVYARVSPLHKLRIVDALQADGHVVAMTGDGVNDAPALRSADIGIAMGRTGTEVTRQAARMILADDNFATIVLAVREGRAIFSNIRKFLRYLLSSNMGEVLTVLLGVLLAGVLGLRGADGALLLPLLATQILWINLVTDSGPALAMGVDPPSGDLMQRPPRRPGQRVIDRAMWAAVLGTGLVMALATLATLDRYLPGGLLDGDRSLAQARTAAFTVLVLAQLFNALNARSGTASAFRDLFGNRWLWAAIGLAVLLQAAVVHLPLFNTAFGTAPLDPGHWLACTLAASSVLWSAEAWKWLLRRRRARAARSG